MATAMDIFRLDGGGVVLGPCPGCTTWTVEYELATAFVNYTAEEFRDLVESLLREHAAECSGLREVIAAL